MKKLTEIVIGAMLAVSMFLSAGCNARVEQGYVGRVSTASGWADEILKPGSHPCYGRDKMYLLDTTAHTTKETLKILIGGKVNLTVDVVVRYRAKFEDKELTKRSFESILADANGVISADQMYKTFLQQKVQAIPKEVYEVCTDVQAATSNGKSLVDDVRKQVMAMSETTPLVVEALDMTNYDWPDAITTAQEALVKIQMKEAEAQAQVKADLVKAEGDLKVATAEKLVEEKRAEAIAESIDIIKDKLANSPEYLMWHQIRVMGEAASGPNNCFILYPYNTDAGQVKGLLENSNLVQMLNPKGPDPELKRVVKKLDNAAVEKPSETKK